MKKIARYRTISEAFDYIKRLDPHTALTENAIRRMVYSGDVQSLSSGTKRFVNLDHLLEILELKEVENDIDLDDLGICMDYPEGNDEPPTSPPATLSKSSNLAHELDKLLEAASVPDLVPVPNPDPDPDPEDNQ